LVVTTAASAAGFAAPVREAECAEQRCADEDLLLLHADFHLLSGRRWVIEERVPSFRKPLPSGDGLSK
jgi:hypothetical protein